MKRWINRWRGAGSRNADEWYHDFTGQYRSAAGTFFDGWHTEFGAWARERRHPLATHFGERNNARVVIWSADIPQFRGGWQDRATAPGNPVNEALTEFANYLDACPDERREFVYRPGFYQATKAALMWWLWVARNFDEIPERNLVTDVDLHTPGLIFITQVLDVKRSIGGREWIELLLTRLAERWEPKPLDAKETR